MPVDVSLLYIGVGPRGFPFLRLRKALYLLQIPFSCVFVNFYLRGIVGDPFTTFNFPVSFFCKLVCISFFVFFVALFVEYFLVRGFLFLPKGANIVRRWSF